MSVGCPLHPQEHCNIYDVRECQVRRNGTSQSLHMMIYHVNKGDMKSSWISEWQPMPKIKVNQEMDIIIEIKQFWKFLAK